MQPEANQHVVFECPEGVGYKLVGICFAIFLLYYVLRSGNWPWGLLLWIVTAILSVESTSNLSVSESGIKIDSLFHKSFIGWDRVRLLTIPLGGTWVFTKFSILHLPRLYMSIFRSNYMETLNYIRTQIKQEN